MKHTLKAITKLVRPDLVSELSWETLQEGLNGVNR